MNGISGNAVREALGGYGSDSVETDCDSDTDSDADSDRIAGQWS